MSLLCFEGWLHSLSRSLVSGVEHVSLPGDIFPWNAVGFEFLYLVFFSLLKESMLKVSGPTRSRKVVASTLFDMTMYSSKRCFHLCQFSAMFL